MFYRSIQRWLKSKSRCRSVTSAKLVHRGSRDTHLCAIERLEDRRLLAAGTIFETPVSAHFGASDVSRIDLPIPVALYSSATSHLAEPTSGSEVARLSREEAGLMVSAATTLWASALDQATLESMAEAAAERWRATGLTEEQSVALDAIMLAYESMQPVIRMQE